MVRVTTITQCLLRKFPSKVIKHGRRLVELGGFVHPTPAKGPQFGTKSRRMVFLSAILLHFYEKFPKFPCAVGANANVNLYSPKGARKIVRFF